MGNHTKKELQLLQEVLTGNKKSQEELYQLYRDKLRNYLKDRCDQYDIEDDISEILIKIFSNIHSYDKTKSKFSTWAYTIANNYIINKSKKKKPEVTHQVYYSNCFDSNTTNSFVIDSYQNSPDFNLEITDSLNYVSNQIGVDNFSMITMKYQGFKYKEIGNTFNMSESSVSNKINYCMTKFNRDDQ